MAELYSRDILKLATSLPLRGEPTSYTHTSRKVSRICGSTLTLWVTMADDRIIDFSLDVKACALGQASTALIGRHLKGLSAASFMPLDARFRQMVTDGIVDFPPVFADFAILAPVFDHKSRRASVLLPFDCLTEIFDLAAGHTTKMPGVVD